MLREACDLASKNVDEAMKLENKGLIAQLVCLPLPLKSQWEFGCRCWRERVGAVRPGAEEGARRRPVCFLGQGPSGHGCFHVVCCYSAGSLV